MTYRQNAFGVSIQAKLFVGSVDIVVGEVKPHEDSGDSQFALDEGDNRDRPPFALENWFFAKSPFNGLTCGGDGGMSDVS